MAILTGSSPLIRIPAGPFAGHRLDHPGQTREQPIGDGQFSERHLRRREPKTATAAGHEVNPAAQSKIHPAILPGLGAGAQSWIRRSPGQRAGRAVPVQVAEGFRIRSIF